MKPYCLVSKLKIVKINPINGHCVLAQSIPSFHLNNHKNQKTSRQQKILSFRKIISIPATQIVFIDFLQGLFIWSAFEVETKNNILHKLAGTSWDSDGSLLRTAALVFLSAEYCLSISTHSWTYQLGKLLAQ